MGDRGNIYLTNRKPDGSLESWLDLYWHWNGTEVPEMAKDGLKCTKGRWDDPSYATSQFIENCIVGHRAPSGISICEFDDNEHEVIEICWTDRMVRIWSPNAHGEMGTLNSPPLAKQQMTFEEFVASS